MDQNVDLDPCGIFKTQMETTQAYEELISVDIPDGYNPFLSTVGDGCLFGPGALGGRVFNDDKDK
jgi:hypothetical protein